MKEECVLQTSFAPAQNLYRGLNAALWLYLASLIAVWGVIDWGGDRWWLATIMMFGPKWIYALPAPILLAWIAVGRAPKNSWLALIGAMALLAGPISHFCIPWRSWTSFAQAELTIFTCNTALAKCNRDRLSEAIAEAQPDVVCLQECRGDLESLFSAEWHILRAGSLVVASRSPVEQLGVVKRDMAGRWPRAICQTVTVEHPTGEFHLACVHLLSPRHGLAEVTDARTVIAADKSSTLVTQTFNRRGEHQRVRDRLYAYRKPLLVVGDFNAPTSSTIYQDCWSDLSNAFSAAGWGFGHTVWIQQGGLTFSARVDHILADSSWTIRKCWVGPSVGSDHRPVVARLSRL